VAVADRRGDAAPAGPGAGRADLAYRDELVEPFALDPSKKVRSYSKGNRQKLALIAGLASRADLLLDEPTSGLDPLMEREFRRCVTEAKAADQTVFLSSHILSEVEALCGRVAILRSGHLVEAGTLADLRHLSALWVEAVFIRGAARLVAGARCARCRGRWQPGRQVHGSVEPLLEQLAAARVTQMLSREPSLEKLFLAQYGAEQAASKLEVTSDVR
jgi:ABC-2 type transport system ATP-binding protein